MPQRAISDATCKSHILTHLRMACGSIFDKSVGSCINNSEFFKPVGSATSAYTPAKCYFGVNSEVVAGSYMLSGISTQDSVVALIIYILVITVSAQCARSLYRSHHCFVISLRAVLFLFTYRLSPEGCVGVL